MPSPKSYYGASVDEHIDKTAPPAPVSNLRTRKPETTPDLHEALISTADQLMEQDHSKPMTTGNLAWALHSIARKIKPPAPEAFPEASPEDEDDE
jgi:hypothetical protein